MLGLDCVKSFYESYKRITEDPELGERFFRRFYEVFLATDARVAERFEDVEMSKQTKMLRESLLVMMDFFANPTISDEMDRLARLHGVKRLEIPDRLYDVWLETLMRTVEELDPKWNRDVELAWRIVMAPGIAFMKWV